MSKVYKVTFDTQRNRVYSNWEYFTEATSQRAAADEARAKWSENGNHAHQFHLSAERAEEIPAGRETRKFKRTDWQPVTWGNVRR